MLSYLKKLLSISNTNKLQEIIIDDTILVDVRTSNEFSIGSAKGAINIPLDQISNQLGKFKNKKHIVVFCRSGNRSGQAKTFLEQNGFDNVVNGGTWQNIQSEIEKIELKIK